jgi:hypothetical protein
VGFDPNLGQYTLPSIASGYGGPDPTLSSCTGTSNPCHLALAVINRGVSTDPTSAAGYPVNNGLAPSPTGWEPREWLVLKDAYTLINIPTGYLNGGVLGDAPAPDGTHPFNTAVFQDQGGNCLLGATCNWATLQTLNGLETSYPQQYGMTPSYNHTTGVSAGYTSFEMGLNIGRMAVEYGATGYNADLNGSFMGIQVADNNSYLAGASIQGVGYVFGF